MNVLLVHNPDAGETGAHAGEIMSLIRRAGHTVSALDRKGDLGPHVREPYDLIAVAGGDGSVSRVARELIGRPTPLTVIPVGTANNLAHSMGLTGEPADLIGAWHDGQIIPFDAARATYPGGQEFFFESAGLGLFTEAMCLAIAHGEPDKFSAEERFDRDFRLLRRLADTLPAFQCSVEVDGQVRNDSVILCEIMNARRIGSRLVLAPSAETGDGRLDLVLVTERDRPLFREFLERDPSDDHQPHLPARQGRRFRVTSQAERIHLSDRIEPIPPGNTPWTLEIEVHPAAVRVLAPRH